MILAIVGIVGVVVLIATAGDGNWGAFAVAAVIIGIIFVMAFQEKEESQAYMNWQHYWATGEMPKQRQAPPQERKLTNDERKANTQRLRDEVRRNEMERKLLSGRYKERILCPDCKTKARVAVTQIMLQDVEMLKCKCPKCGVVLMRERYGKRKTM